MARARRDAKNRQSPLTPQPPHDVPNDVPTATPLEDVLAATAQHSVPLLPASDTTGATVPGPEASTTRITTSYARRTLAPIPAVQPAPQWGRAPDDSTALDVSSYSTRISAAPPPVRPSRASGRLAAQPRRTYGPQRGHDDGDATSASDEAPGRPTIALRALTNAQLPAVVSDEQRALALKAETEPEPPALFIRGATRMPASYAPPLAPRRRGSRPFAAQFIISMVTVMVLFTTLTLASPLGHGSAFANAFQVYANAVPWVPTPTPTPKPPPLPAFSPPLGANPGQQAIINEIVAVFGSYAQGALNIARCESGYDPNARNPYAIGNSHASGVFQILYPSTWDTTSYASQSPYDYNANIHAAYQIFSRDGHSWVEWACKP
jgi:hypothetical protein